MKAPTLFVRYSKRVLISAAKPAMVLGVIAATETTTQVFSLGTDMSSSILVGSTLARCCSCGGGGCGAPYTPPKPRRETVTVYKDEYDKFVKDYESQKLKSQTLSLQKSRLSEDFSKLSDRLTKAGASLETYEALLALSESKSQEIAKQMADPAQSQVVSGFMGKLGEFVIASRELQQAAAGDDLPLKAQSEARAAIARESLVKFIRENPKVSSVASSFYARIDSDIALSQLKAELAGTEPDTKSTDHLLLASYAKVIVDAGLKGPIIADYDGQKIRSAGYEMIAKLQEPDVIDQVAKVQDAVNGIISKSCLPTF